jgi:hypothetical protein
MLKLKDIPRTKEHLWKDWGHLIPFSDLTYTKHKFETIRTFDNGKHYFHYLMNSGVGREGVEICYEYDYNMDDYFY